jgi:chromosome segregation ATPase
LAPGDTRPLAAYWLVLLHQRRYEESLTRLNEYLQKQPGSLTALQAKTWVQTLLQKYDLALVTADQLSQLLANQQATAGGPQDQSVQFLGRLFGYLAGPAEDALDQQRRQRAEAAVTARLEERSRELFMAARSAVSEQYAKMAADVSDAVQDAKDSAEATREQAVAKLAEQREEQDKRAKDVETRQQQVQKDLDDHRRKLDERDAELAKNEKSLRQRVTHLENEVRRHDTDAARYAGGDKSGARTVTDLQNRNSPKGSRDPRYYQATRKADNARDELNRVTAQLNQLQFDRNSVQVLRAEAQKAAVARTQELTRERAGIDAANRRLEGKEKRTIASKSGTLTGQATSQGSKLRALSTYDQLPLEEYRARLTAALRATR